MNLKLTTKFTLVTGLVLLVTMLLFALYNVKTMENISMKDTLREVDHLAETLISTTHYQMLEDDRQRAYQMMEEVGEQEDIEGIRLFNKEGVIIFSTDKNEIGTRVGKNADACNGCHSYQFPLSQAPTSSRSRFFTNQYGAKILGVTRSINNKESCSTAACHIHADDPSMLGILDVQVSLAGMQALLSTYQKSVLGFTFFLLSMLGLCLTFLTQRFVNRPVREILQHTGRLSRGDLSSRIGSKRRDELGELATAFDVMAQNLEEVQSELQDWTHTLEARIEERTGEIKEMQSQLVQSAKLASLGELVAGIAHEINNPLTGILMFSSLASRNPRLDPSLKLDMEMIVGETQRCARIVHGLLEFSRESIPEKTLVSIHGIMDRTLKLLAQQVIFQNIDIIRNYAPDLPEIPVDCGQIEQVFMNVVLNAGQAMPEGGMLTITTGLLDADKSIFVRLTDCGTGITEENLCKIFDPFFTTKDRKGTGLGLSISYGIIENHGGQIEVQSRVGKGTIVTIMLPAIAPMPDRQAPPSLTDRTQPGGIAVVQK